MICTDGIRQLPCLADLGYGHEFFTRLDSEVPDPVELTALHMVASVARQPISGSLHPGIGREQMDY